MEITLASTPVRTAHMCVVITSTIMLCYTIQHWTVLIIFPLILQTIITAQMMSIRGEGTGKEVRKEVEGNRKEDRTESRKSN